MKKTINSLLFVLLLSPLALSAHDKYVLLKTSADIQKVNSIASSKNFAGDSITVLHVHDFFWNESKIYVRQHGSSSYIAKKDLFGYRDNQGRTFRFFENEEYEIVDTEGFYLYRKMQLVPQGKSYRKEATFFFSTKADSQIWKMNWSNLSKIFSDKPEFLELVRVYSAKDNCSKHSIEIDPTLVNKLFIQSTKK